MTGSLEGKVAIVTGASRGAGRGIARVLGEAGATVYVTGRTQRSNLTVTASEDRTVDHTAEEVTALGGHGIAVKVDHTDDMQVEALFEQVRDEQRGRLDILVNNVWGGYEDIGKDFIDNFWQQPLWRWDKMFQSGVRAHYTASRLAAPLMIAHHSGLIVNTTFWDQDTYLRPLSYDLAKGAINRMASGMARKLRDYGVAAVALSPGWMRTEAVLDHVAPQLTIDSLDFDVFKNWERTESVAYIGRAVLALATDPAIMDKSGETLCVGNLAQEYGFTDIDGRQPPAFKVDYDQIEQDLPVSGE